MRYPTIFCTLLLCPYITSQDVTIPTRGYFASIATALSVKGVNGLNATLDPAKIAISQTGYQTTVPGEVSGLTPDFRFRKVLSLPGGGSSYLDFDGMSAGNDFLEDLNTDSGSMAGWITPSNNWLAIVFSLSPGSTGEQFSALEVLTADRGDNIGGDLLSTYFPGSAGIPVHLITNSMWLEQLGEEQSITKKKSTAVEDLDAVDLFIPMLINNPEIVAALGMAFNKFYFSLSQDTLWNSPSAWWKLPSGSNSPRSGATIFVAEWSNNAWLMPKIFKTYAELGLNQNEDVDALAVDNRDATRSEIIVFSTTTSTRNQLLCTDSSGDARPIKDKDGKIMTDKIKLKSTDDIDAICVFDPKEEFVQHIPGPQPLPISGIEDANLGLSTWKRIAGRGINTMVVTHSGWMDEGAQDCVMEFSVATNPNLSDLTPLASVVRFAHEDTKQVSFTIPPYVHPIKRTWLVVTLTTLGPFPITHSGYMVLIEH